MRFSYTAKDAKGKTITAIEDAVDQSSLIARLQKQGYFIVSIAPVSDSQAKKAHQDKSPKGPYTHTKVKLDDLLIFCRQLATMLDAGVTLLRSLDVISMQVESKTLAQTLMVVKKDVEQGGSLSASLAKHPKVFNQLWISLVEVGEASGTMPTVLEKLAFYLERQAAFNSSVVSAIIYPLILLVVATLAILLFALVIGPRFKSIFDSFHVELPVLTRVLLGVFDFIKTKFFVLIGLIGGIVIVVRKYVQTPRGKQQAERIIFAVPKFGFVVRTIVVERFTSQMSILVDSGVPILYALDITQRMIGNKTCEAVIGEIKDTVREGKLVAEQMGKSGFFPPMAVQMIAIGEETGELGKMLKRVSQYYQDYVETFMKRFGVIFEPFMLVFMGGIIGVIVIAMFLPIFSIATLGG